MSDSINPLPQKHPASLRRTWRKLNEKAATPEKFGDPTGEAASKAVSAKADATLQCSTASSPLQVEEAPDVE